MKYLAVYATRSEAEGASIRNAFIESGLPLTQQFIEAAWIEEPRAALHNLVCVYVVRVIFRERKHLLRLDEEG